jgi:hypothetical protein
MVAGLPGDSVARRPEMQEANGSGRNVQKALSAWSGDDRATQPETGAGRASGAADAANDAFLPAGQASVPLRVVRDPGGMAGERVCIFVSYAPDGRIKPHVRFHLAALKRNGLAILYVMVVDEFPSPEITEALADNDHGLLRGLVVRRNAGFDFGAWADAFRIFPALWTAKAVLLVNDSVFGPFGDFDSLMARALTLPADVIGMTESPEITPHFQSYFLLFKEKALSDPGARAFWRDIVNLASKRETILTYEVPLVAGYRERGLACTALFPWHGPTGRPWLNPTHHNWRSLLAAGFPYIKVELLRDNPARIDIRGWRKRIGDREHLAAIEQTLAVSSNGTPRPRGYAEARGRLSTGFPQAMHRLVHRVTHKLARMQGLGKPGDR